MRKDYTKLHLGSITVRLPISLIQDLDLKSGAGQKFRDRSDAVRTFLALGMRVQSIMDIQNNPEKSKEFQEKFASLLQENNIEKSLETMDESQLNGISFYIQNLKDKKVQQLLDDIKLS